MKLVDQSAQTNWKFIAIVAFVAVFLVGGILMLIPQLQESTPPLPQHNNSQVEGWQTYRNEEFGFELKYSKDEWEFPKTYPFDAVEFRSRRVYAYITIYILPIEEGKTADEVMITNTGLGECGASDCRHPSRDQFLSRKLGANSFYYIHDNLFEQQYRVTYYLPNPSKNRVVQFRLSSVAESRAWTDPDYNADEEPTHSTLKQILSTFRFVEK